MKTLINDLIDKYVEKKSVKLLFRRLVFYIFLLNNKQRKRRIK